jgi:hypothetical protein
VVAIGVRHCFDCSFSHRPLGADGNL